MTNRVIVPARQATKNRFLGSLNVYNFGARIARIGHRKAKLLKRKKI
jgi:hypothetical protein